MTTSSIDEAAAAAERYKDHMENVENAITGNFLAMFEWNNIPELVCESANGYLGNYYYGYKENAFYGVVALGNVGDVVSIEIPYRQYYTQYSVYLSTTGYCGVHSANESPSFAGYIPSENLADEYIVIAQADEYIYYLSSGIAEFNVTQTEALTGNFLAMFEWNNITYMFNSSDFETSEEETDGL